MITPSDDSYKATKRIMQGKAVMNPNYNALAEWIQNAYGVKPVNIIYSIVENGKLPRLEICLEYESGEALFINKDRFSFNKNRQQAINAKFKESGGGKKLNQEVWVVFSNFEKVAKAEANESIPSDAIDQLKQQFSEDGLWEISRFMQYTTFFVHTQKQVAAYKDSDTLKKWADTYFLLLKQYDEFNYFQRETMPIVLDSKENFIDNYQGNWYYYYK